VTPSGGVKGIQPGHNGVAELPRGDAGGPRGALAILQWWQMQAIVSLYPRPSVHGEEPHPTSGDPDLRE